jgi:hypothetical protein
LVSQSIEDINYLEKDYLHHLAKSKYIKGKGRGNQGISIEQIDDIYDNNMKSIAENKKISCTDEVELVQFKRKGTKTNKKVNETLSSSICNPPAITMSNKESYSNPLHTLRNNREIDSDDEI